jgi:uncharacterized membrane protein YedE/YeeE
LETTLTGLTPLLAPLAGGALIGLAVAILLLFDGRLAGISGIVAGVVRPVRGEWAWRASFLAGLLAGGAVARVVDRDAIGPMQAPVLVLALAGLLVGYGTRLAGGCTSGHGVCGVSRGAKRSLAATATFLAVAGLVVLLVRHGARW